MVDITPGTVTPTSETDIGRGTAGATLTEGQAVKLDTATQRYVAAQATLDGFAGVALHDAESGQPLAFAKSGPIDFTGALVKGTVYVVSAAAAGGIAPWADLVATNFVTVIGVATTTGQLEAKPLVSGATI